MLKYIKLISKYACNSALSLKTKAALSVPNAMLIKRCVYTKRKPMDRCL